MSPPTFLNDFLVPSNDSLLQTLDLCYHLKALGVATLQIPPSMDVEGSFLLF